MNGCAIVSHGRMAKIPSSQVNSIQVGVTTKEEILKKFGEPQKILTKPNGVEVFVYMGGVEQQIGIPFIISLGRTSGSGQTLTITFRDRVVVDYEFSIDQRGMLK